MEEQNTASTQPTLALGLTKKQHLIAIIIGTLPLIIGLCLFLANAEYMGRLIYSGPTQPFGWMFIGTMFLLIIFGYLGLLVSFYLSNGSSTPKWLGFVLIGGIILLCYLPALALLLLAPTFLLIIDAGIMY